MVGCDIFGILLKMEKVILVISTLGASSPPPQADPESVRERQAPGGGGVLKQGLLWLQEGELAQGASCLSHDALYHHHLAALGPWGQGGQAPDIRVLSSVLQVVETPDRLSQVLPALQDRGTW